jgi:hypothetical protein
MGILLLAGATTLLLACQALGLPSNLGFGSGRTPSASGAPPSVMPRATAAEPSAAPTSDAGPDPRQAARAAQAYLEALVAGNYAAAWQLLAPAAQTAWPSEHDFAAERAAFYASAGPRLTISDPDGSAATLATWLPHTFDGDRGRAFVIAVDHPAIHTNAAREVLIAAPDAAGRWRIWIAR